MNQSLTFTSGTRGDSVSTIDSKRIKVVIAASYIQLIITAGLCASRNLQSMINTWHRRAAFLNVLAVLDDASSAKYLTDSCTFQAKQGGGWLQQGLQPNAVKVPKACHCDHRIFPDIHSILQDFKRLDCRGQ